MVSSKRFELWCLGGMIFTLFAPGAGFTQQSYVVSGSAGIAVDTHLVSYGRDVWQAGNEGGSLSAGLIHPWVEGKVSFSPFSISSGIWLDVNDNTKDSFSGYIQEADFWLGMTWQYQQWQTGLTYNRWHYASDTEDSLDAWIYLNDYNMWLEDFGFYPVIKLHSQLQVEHFDPASTLVFKVSPGWALSDAAVRPIWLSVPLEVGFQQEGYRNHSGGYGFTSLGGQLTVPLVSVPKEHGVWNLQAALTFYSTDSKRIPENIEADYLTGKLGLVAYF